MWARVTDAKFETVVTVDVRPELGSWGGWRGERKEDQNHVSICRNA